MARDFRNSSCEKPKGVRSVCRKPPKTAHPQKRARAVAQRGHSGRSPSLQAEPAAHAALAASSTSDTATPGPRNTWDRKIALRNIHGSGLSRTAATLSASAALVKARGASLATAT